MTARSTALGTSPISAASPGAFTAGRIRDADFPEARRGYDKAAVRAYLHGVAEEVAGLYRELAIARNETIRHKNALRDWQSQQASLRNDPQQAPPLGPTGHSAHPTPQATAYEPAHGQHYR